MTLLRPVSLLCERFKFKSSNTFEKYVVKERHGRAGPVHHIAKKQYFTSYDAVLFYNMCVRGSSLRRSTRHFSLLCLLRKPELVAMNALHKFLVVNFRKLLWTNLMPHTGPSCTDASSRLSSSNLQQPLRAEGFHKAANYPLATVNHFLLSSRHMICS